MASAEMSQKEIRMMKRVAMLKKEASFESQLAEGQPKRARASTDVAVEPLPAQVTSFRRQDTSVGCSLCATLDLPQCLDFEPTALRGVGLFEELCIVCNHDRSVHIQPRRAKERSSKHEKSAREERGSPPRKNSALFALDLEAVAPVGDGSPSPRRRQRLLSSPNVNFRTGRAVDALDLVAQRRAGSVPHGAGEQALAGALETRKSKAGGSGKGGYARRFLGKAKMLKQSASEERKKSRQVVDGQKTEEVPRRKSETNLKNISLAQPPGAPRKGDADTPRSREEQVLRTELHHLQTSLSAAEKELRHTKGRIQDLTMPLRKLSSPGVSQVAFTDVINNVRRASHEGSRSGGAIKAPPQKTNGETVHSRMAGRMAATESVIENGKLLPLQPDVEKPRREGSSRTPRGLREVGSEAELMKQGMLREYHLVSRTGSNRVRPKLHDAATGLHRSQQLFADLLQQLRQNLYEPLRSRMEDGQAHRGGDMTFGELGEIFGPYLELRSSTEAVVKAANRLVSLSVSKSSKETNQSSDDLGIDRNGSAKNKPVKRAASAVSSHQLNNSKVKRKNKRNKKLLSATRKLAAAVEAQLPLFAKLTSTYPRCYSLASRPDWRAALADQQRRSTEEGAALAAAEFVAFVLSSPFENAVELLRGLARIASSRPVSSNTETLDCVCATISHLQLLKKNMHFMLCNLTKLAEGSATKFAPEVAALLPAAAYLLHESRIRFFTDFAALKSLPGTLSVFTSAAVLQVEREETPLLLRATDILAVFSDVKRYLPPPVVDAVKDNALVRSVLDSVLAIVTLEGSLLLCTESPKEKTMLCSQLMGLIDSGHNSARSDPEVKGKSCTAEAHQQHQLLWDTLV